MTAPDGPLRFSQPTWGRPRRRRDPDKPQNQAPTVTAADVGALSARRRERRERRSREPQNNDEETTQ